MLKTHKQTIQNQTFIMLPVEGGPFLMGSLEDDAEGYDDERPQHEVSVSDFLIGQFPVTQALWKAAMNGENPSDFQGDEHPVEQVSWDDITQQFLPELRKITGLAYRLPTEAEWEYAARGGKYNAEGYKYAGSDRLKDVGWFRENSDESTKPVGLKSANQLGIYDMSGNVREWCEDWYAGSEYYAICHEKGTVENPRGPAPRARRVYRGGSWNQDAQFCRSSCRFNWLPAYRNNDLGFRLALSLQVNEIPLPSLI